MKRAEIYGLFLFALLAICGTIAYIGHVRDVATADATTAQNEQFRKQIREDLKADIDALRGQIQAAKTPAQQAQIIREYMPYAVPATPPRQDSDTPATSPRPTSDTVATVPLPDAPSALLIKPEQFPQLLKDIQVCKENELGLKACQAQIPLLEQERDKWEKAAKGGSWLSRTKTRLIWMGIGVGAGYALSKR